MLAWLFPRLAYLIMLLPPSGSDSLEQHDSVPNEYIVELGPDLSAADVLSALSGSRIIDAYSIGSIQFVLVKTDGSALVTLAGSGARMTLVPNMMVELVGFGNGSACSYQKSGKTYWGLTRISHVERPTYRSPQDTYRFENAGKRVSIYVMDTGINVDHLTFGNRAYAHAVEPIATDEGPADGHGHGTHVAGLAAGSLYGTAKHATIVSVKVFSNSGQSSYALLVAGLDFIAKHMEQRARPDVASVINMSFEIQDSGQNLNLLDRIIRAMPTAVVVVAAGNKFKDACDVIPARYNSVITVAATGTSDNMALYSNYGPCVDILAPGNNLASASSMDNTSQIYQSGTSQASGFVSGVVARLLQNSELPLSTADIRTLLQATASVNKTNAGEYNTVNLLLHASCGDPVSAVSVSAAVATTQEVTAPAPQTTPHVARASTSIGLAANKPKASEATGFSSYFYTTTAALIITASAVIVSAGVGLAVFKVFCDKRNMVDDDINKLVILGRA